MSDAAHGPAPVLPGPRPRLRGWTNRLIASRGFQRWAARFPLTRGVARREGEALFDLVAGFLHSQVLQALVEMRVLHLLVDGPLRLEELARRTGMPVERAQVMMKAAAALGLVRIKRGGKVALARTGAAMLGVPGLEAMIQHHSVLYRDLADPVAFFRGETDTELAAFWPYVFGAGQAQDPQTAQRYSDLMADSQGLVAEETLAHLSLSGTRHLLDVGGGTGAFLSAVATTYPDIKGTLFDLPAVVPTATRRFQAAGVGDRIDIVAGSFRDEALPRGADAVSLIRVLYDHADDTVRALLSEVKDALPPDGRLIISEPMSGGPRPERAGDAYFAIYTMAMGTGKTRSQQEIARLLQAAGFVDIKTPRTHRPFVTGIVTARVGS
ncbi:MAG: methyltransferase [Pseudomonadota bacterium]